MFLHNSGKLEAVIVDEKVPVENQGDNMFILEPQNHSKAREFVELPKSARFGSPRQRPLNNTEIEIWPQLLAKGMAKNLGCYERLLNQDLSNTLTDLTGMPVKNNPVHSIEFKWLRENYKRSSVMICKASKSWITQRKRDCTGSITDQELELWAISQVVTLSEGKQMIEIRNHYCDKPPKQSNIIVIVDWNTEEYLKITEDWMKYRRYKKMDSSFWINYDDFKNNFNSIICSSDRSDDFQIFKRLDYKNSGSAACQLDVTQSTVITISIGQLDIVNYPKEYEYTVIRSFILKENTHGKNDLKEPFELLKSVYHPAIRDNYIDIKLEKGHYKLLLDIEHRASDYGKLLNLNFFSNKKVKVTALAYSEADSLHKSTLSSLAIRRGSKTSLSDDGSVRKYALEVPKLGLMVHTYANRSAHFYAVAEKLGAFDMLCSKALEDGDKLLVSLPPNSLKIVTFRHPILIVPPVLRILETSCLMK